MTKNWFIHIDGQVLGPLTTEAILKMLNQNRLSFVDFIWCDNFTKWHRVMDVDDFAKEMPTYPAIKIPSSSAVKNEKTGKNVETQSVASAPAPKVKHDKPVIAEKPKAAKMAAEPEITTEAPPVKTEKNEKSVKPKEPEAPNTREQPMRIVPINVSATVKDHDEYVVVNLSETGIFLSATAAPSVGLEVKFKLNLKPANKTLDMTGVIVRHGDSKGTIGFAIQFRRLNPAHRRVLLEYMIEHTIESE